LNEERGELEFGRIEDQKEGEWATGECLHMDLSALSAEGLTPPRTMKL